MVSYKLFDDIAEMAHMDETTFFNECDKVLQAKQSTTSIAQFKAFSKIGDFLNGTIGPANQQQTRDLIGQPIHLRFMREITLETKPNQQIVKRVEVYWWRPITETCHTVIFEFPIQFLGYGSYSLCHYNNGGLSDRALNEFFNTLSQNRCNFHRTMIWSSGNYEIKNQPVVPLLKMINGKLSPNPDFFINLRDMVAAARRYGVIVQVCLFNHTPIAAQQHVPMPPEFPDAQLGTDPWTRYKNFFNTNCAWMGLQKEIIEMTTKYLMNFWNVVYEVGNELRVPKPNATYGEPHLRSWVAWAAGLLKSRSYGKLVTVSSGIHNETGLNNLPALAYASFHGGQWYNANALQTGIDQARVRAAGLGDKHVVIDDDGQVQLRDQPDEIKKWATAALTSGGDGQCSFNHKGPYSPLEPISPRATAELNALRDAWNGVFKRYSPGVNVFIPKQPVLS